LLLIPEKFHGQTNLFGGGNPAKPDLNPYPAGHIFFRMHPGTNIGGMRWGTSG
jgi:hypothetical protein